MNPFTWIKNQTLFQDRRALLLLVLGFLAMVFLAFFTALNIEDRDFKIPVRYSGYMEGSLSDRGDSASLYVLPFFIVATFVINAAISLKVHRMRPELAKALLGLNLVVAAFAFFVSRALLNLL